MCCAIVAVLLALFPAWTCGREAVLRWLAQARGLAILSAALVAVVAGSAFASSYTTPKDSAPWMARICGFMDFNQQLPTRRR
jgi:hypothetical protein